MAFTLVAFRTRPDKRKQLGVGTISFVVHASVIVAAVYATARVANADTAVRTDTAMVFLAQPPAQTPPLPPPVLDAPLKGFQTLTVPTVIPTTIPPVNLTEHFDPKDYTGIGVEGGKADGVAPNPDAVYADAAVEEHPEPLTAPPTYPEAMRMAGIQGRVMLEAIIDTLGRVEPGSVRIIRTPNVGFDGTVREWALRAQFRPARLHGRAVRALVHLPFDFNSTNN
jgi:periplasmic protein TonB